MCRLFGIISNKRVNINFSMNLADNSFKDMSHYNHHGWGIGWFEINGISRIEKDGNAAYQSEKFNNLSKKINSKIIIAHVRLASSGRANVEINSHPFEFNNWIFAHNGTINENKLSSMLKYPFNYNLTSQGIDSELYFRYIMQCINETGDMENGIRKALEEINNYSQGANFLLSDGKKLIAYRYGNDLYYCIRDSKKPLNCRSEETRLMLESKSLAGEKAIVFCSERLTKDEEWIKMYNKTLIICDTDLRMVSETIL